MHDSSYIPLPLGKKNTMKQSANMYSPTAWQFGFSGGRLISMTHKLNGHDRVYTVVSRSKNFCLGTCEISLQCKDNDQEIITVGTGTGALTFSIFGVSNGKWVKFSSREIPSCVMLR